MNEYWAKDIVSARIKFQEGNFESGLAILKELLNSKNPDCVKESKRLLAKTLLEFDDKKEIAKKYLEEIFNENKDIQTAIDLMILSSSTGDLLEVRRYYDECIALLEKDTRFNMTMINFLYLSSLAQMKNSFSEAILPVNELISAYKKVQILDYHFLITRNLPSFYDFIEKVKVLYISNDRKSDFITFLKEQLLWSDESGKDIINETLNNLKL